MANEVAEKFTVVINPCPHCGEEHRHDVFADLLNQNYNTLNFLCPNITRFPRLTDFYVDFRVDYRNLPEKSNQNMKRDIFERVKFEHGEQDVEDKFLRWEEISRANIWLVDDYNNILREVVAAYIQGFYYVAMTSACCLSERVLNRLVIKLKTHFKHSDYYKEVYNKEQKLQDWSKLIKILRSWEILSDDQVRICKQLHKYRNDTVHYIPEYNFQSSAPKAIKLSIELIDSLFSVFARQDIFHIFVIPGEIWVKEAKVKNPFVQEFVLSHCRAIGAVSQVEDNNYLEDGAIVGELSEEEFIRIRMDYNRNPEKYLNGKKPTLMQVDFEGKQKFIRVV